MVLYIVPAILYIVLAILYIVPNTFLEGPHPGRNHPTEITKPDPTRGETTRQKSPNQTFSRQKPLDRNCPKKSSKIRRLKSLQTTRQVIYLANFPTWAPQKVLSKNVRFGWKMDLTMLGFNDSLNKGTHVG